MKKGMFWIEKNKPHIEKIEIWKKINYVLLKNTKIKDVIFSLILKDI